MEGGTFPISFNFKYDDYKIDCNLNYKGLRSVVTSGKTKDWYDKHEDLANKAIAAFLFCFTCVTAANVQVYFQSNQISLKQFLVHKVKELLLGKPS